MSMQFSDTSGLSGLVEDIDFICGTDATSYPLKDKARNANQWLYTGVVTQILANKKWQFADINATTLPVFVATMVNAQQDYALPTDLLRLQAVEIKDAGGNWQRLKPIDKDDLKRSITDFENVNGTPRYYDVVGTSLMLYPAPATAGVTLTSGLKLHYSPDIDLFVSTDTTQKPTLPPPFHRLVSYGASYDWLMVNGPEERCNRVMMELEKAKVSLKKFVSSLDEGTKISIKPLHQTSEYA